MDRLVIERKLDSLQRCISRIQDKVPADMTRFAEDLDAQDVVVLNLSRAQLQHPGHGHCACHRHSSSG